MEENQNKKQLFESFPVDKETIRNHHKSWCFHTGYKGHFFSTLTLKFLKFFLTKISSKFAYKIGALLGKTAYFFKTRKKVVMKNLDIVYKDTKTMEEKEEIYKNCLINVGRYAVNFFRLPFMPQSFWDKNVEFENEEALKKVFNKKKGVILIGAHIGMWDLACGKLGASGYPVALVGKNVSNPAVHHCVCETRIRMNFAAVKNRGSLKHILQELKCGGGIVMTVDQDMNAHRGIYLNWLGHPAYSVASTAFVAKKTGAAVIPIVMYQKSHDKFLFKCGDEIPWIEHDDHSKEIEINAQNHSDVVQKWIYEAPELWFWLHKRYKTQPDGKKIY